MNPQGPNPPGGGPDDRGEGEEGHPGGHGPDEGTDNPRLRGWVPPEDRLWRHPSEVSPAPSGGPDPRSPGAPEPAIPGAGSSGTPPPDPARSAPGGGGGHRWHPWAMGVVGSGAAAAVVAGIVLLNSVGSGGSGGSAGDPSVAGSTTTTSFVEGTSGSTVPAMARSDVAAIVALQVTSANGTTTDCGVAVSEGGLVATPAAALAGATSVRARTSTGHWEAARLVGMDRASDLALVRVPDNVPLPHFDTTPQLSAGRGAMVVSIEVRAASVAPVWSIGTVEAASATVTGGSAKGMAAIAATVPVVPQVSGNLLVESDGAIAGILDPTGSATANPGAGTFLPAALVLGVTADLATSGRVRHGWLDVGAQDTGVGTPGAGALVASVEPKGAAADLLHVGDVIVGVGDQPVRSMAELRSTLYVLPPGAAVDLEIRRGGARTTVAVRLAASP